MLNLAGFVRRHAPIFITSGAVLGGAYVGYMLTHGLLLGVLLSLSLVWLRRPPPLPPPPAPAGAVNR